MTFSQIFQGNEHHRGITANGKYSHYLDKNTPFNHEEHLKGIKSQGLSPLRQKTNEEEAYCIYGGLDFDFEVIPPAAEFCKSIYDISPELFVFESKSSGYHVYWFADNWIKAAKMKAAMERLKKKINPKYKADRVIPYETKLKDITTQCGFWFNAPYYADTRRCLNHLGEPLKLEQFELKYKLRKHHFLSAIVGWKAAKKGTGKTGRHLVLWQATLYQKYRMPGEEKILDEINNCFNPPIEDERELEHAKDLKDWDEEHLDRNLKNYFKEIGIEEKIPEPPPDFWEGANEFEDLQFNNGPGTTDKSKTPRLEIITGDDIFFSEDIPINWAIENILPEGMTILAALPKIGKSWLALQIAIAVENALEVLGFKVKKGRALYCAYEDNRRRLKGRFKKIGVKPGDKRPDFIFKSCSLTEGLEEQIETWIKETPDAQLVVIDTYYHALPTSLKRSFKERYEIDSKNLAKIHRIALDYNIAIIIVHHTTKGKHDDTFNEISGSVAMQSIADTLWVISSDRKAGKDSIFNITGRDIEQQYFQIGQDVNCKWLNKGKPGENLESEDEKQIKNTIKELDQDSGVYPREVTANLKLTDKGDI